MTAEQENNLNDLYDAYVAAENIYQIELQQNTQGKANFAQGIYRYPWNNQLVTQQIFTQWLAGSDASLLFKESKKISALNDYNNFKNDILELEQSAAITSDPRILVDLANVQAQAQVQSQNTQGKLIIEASEVEAAQKRKKIIIISVVSFLVVAATIVVIYFIRKPKKSN